MFGTLWKSPVPLKVVVFSWKALLDRIPTKSNLALRNMLPPDMSVLCVWCGRVAETEVLIFLHCGLANGAWLNVMRWWNFNLVTPPNLFIHWACWSGVESRKRVKKGLWLVWHATIWVLWKGRNNRIFNDGVEFVDDLVEEIKVLSWRWAMSRLHMQTVYVF